MKRILLGILLTVLFYRSPKVDFSDKEINEYDKLFSDAVNGDGTVRYSSSFPKWRFIQYVSKHKDVLLHGSNNGSIQTFEPRKQTLYNGKFVEAVFATKDGIWPMFYAVLDKDKLQGGIRNGCFDIGQNRKFYYFSITRETRAHHPWTKGTLYFLPLDSFEKVSHETISFDEWISKNDVTPLAKLDVDVNDFYYHHKVAAHRDGESLYKTLFMYKMRSMFR